MRPATLLAALSLALAVPQPALAQSSFVNFESGQVRPMALSADTTRLYVVNTPDNRLEIFSVDAAGIAHIDSVPVGMDPVAVAERSGSEVWVVNHLSDSVSIVDVSASPARVVRTLLVGDEPRDIVFAGTGGNRAFITTAHRGQHRTHSSISGVTGAGDPQLTTASVGRADVWVFDATGLGSTIGGTPLEILSFFTDTPRALAVSNDGSTVYVAALHSGNQTTVVSEGSVCNGFASAGTCSGDGVTSPGGLAGGQMPGGNPGPSANVQSVGAPEVGLIVKYDNAAGIWKDELARNWNNGVRFDLPDEDVFAIDATTLNQVALHAHVGTTLFNMIVNPANDDLYVTNQEAINEVRFEGPGVVGGSTVQGHLAEMRVTIIDNPDTTDASGASVKPRHLNSHIDYNTLASDGGFDATAKNHSLAIPLQMDIDSTGTMLYVAAFGSSKIGVINTAALEGGTFDPTSASAAYLSLSGGGPSGVALDENRSRLYVLTRFDNTVSVIDLGTGSEGTRVALHNPEPAVVTTGRPFLYDAFNTSGNGEASCASCHIFGDLDQLGWDLGNPDDNVGQNPTGSGDIKLSVGADGSTNGGADVDEFHPMKGPMTTQTLRGLVNSGPMHWRGDRADGFFGQGLGENLSFNNFIVAFEGLVGRSSIVNTGDMQSFTDFALTMPLPPNPVRALDNSLTSAQQSGRNFYTGTRRADGIPFLPGLGFTCEGCHTLDASQGHFGTDGTFSFENESQILKIAHLRNLYQKVGMFGMPDVDFLNGGSNGHQGDQIRGFGFLHDGSVDTIFRFFQATVFNDNAGVGFDGGDNQRRDMEQFMLAFDNDIAPIVGQQITLDGGNSGVVGSRITLMIQRAGTSFTSQVLGGTVTECDVVVKGNDVATGEARGWMLQGGVFVADKAADPALSDAALRARAGTAGQELTYTCAPPGSGTRMGIDRDEDTVLDGDDNCPAVDNPGQQDSNSNGVGDACEVAGPTTTSTTTSTTFTTSSSTTTTSTTSSTTTTTLPITTTTSTTSTTSTSTSSTTSTSTSTTTSTSTSTTSTTSTSTSTSTSTTSTTLPPFAPCGPAPEPDGACHLADASGAGKSSIFIRDRGDNSKDQIKWKWSKGAAVATAQFGSPDSSTSTYRVCIYDASGLQRALDLPAGGVEPICDGAPCWRATGTKGFSYKHKAGGPDGITGAKLREGTAGKSKIQIKARGGNVGSPFTLPLAAVVVQLLIDDGATTECFKTTFPSSGVSKQDDRTFKAKGP